MSRDYKNRVTRKQRKTLSPWLGVVAGLLIGLFVAFLVYIKSQSRPGEPVYVQETLPPVAADITEDVRDVRKDDTAAIPPPPKPRFDFYTLLPEIEVVVPEEEITQSLQQHRPPLTPARTAPASEAKPPDTATSVHTAPVNAAKPPASATPAHTAPVDEQTPAASPVAGTFYLQVGSFSDAGKADRFKAELALMGLQTSIQTVTINSTDTYHRVRVGPFGSLDELDKIRTRLKQKGIDSTPIKVRG